ncbi:M20/M25/M40 family metallo-hydrolase [Dethiosulfovibrio salsuginis]|uniref:Tripeptide aminopeptidase n=1 Tax=Dethiosulfovibrio salsuginis TaxID=561720 RepID=A0A1X7J5Z8_9BACT|nr:M20/M25/M40 family metallo-hydrolase [Dethiosulfovibrio salsuginis]SMG22818.1 tripeptide aminopeptidase [Dethiosulfovibrio salsuginis]
MIDNQRLIKNFIELAQIMAPSGKERPVAEALIPELKKLGLQVTVDETTEKTGSDHGNIIATLPPSEGMENWKAFMAHMDTVPLPHPTRPIVKGDSVFSDGTTVLGADDRAGIAIIMEALRTVVEKDLPHPGLEIIFTVSEENGIWGSKALDTSSLKSSMAFVLDSSTAPGAIIATAPFATALTWNVIGVAAHAGVAPEKGVNAIQAASRGISSMKIGRIDEETTANVGAIRGGHATNVVCDRVEIKAEARSLNEGKLKDQLNHMRSTMKKAVADYGASLEEKIDDKYPGFSLSKESPVVLEASRALGEIGLTPKVTSTGGGSDANVLNYKGLPAVNLGIGYQRAHSTEEHISIESIETMARATLNMMTKD